MIQVMFVCCLQICEHLLMLFGTLPSPASKECIRTLQANKDRTRMRHHIILAQFGIQTMLQVVSWIRIVYATVKSWNRLIYSWGSFIPPWIGNWNGLANILSSHIVNMFFIVKSSPHSKLPSHLTSIPGSNVCRRQVSVFGLLFHHRAALKVGVPYRPAAPPQKKNVWLLPRMTDTCPNPTGERFGNIDSSIPFHLCPYIHKSHHKYWEDWSHSIPTSIHIYPIIHPWSISIIPSAQMLSCRSCP